MTISVEEYVNEGISDLAWRTEIPAVPAVGKHLSAPAEAPIQAFCEPNRKPLHTPTKRIRVVSLYDQVQVLELNRIVHDAKAVAIGVTKLRLDGAAQASQRRHTVPSHVKRRVHRPAPTVFLAAHVPSAGQAGKRLLAPRPFALPAMGAEFEACLASPHLDSAPIMAIAPPRSKGGKRRDILFFSVFLRPCEAGANMSAAVQHLVATTATTATTVDWNGFMANPRHVAGESARAFSLDTILVSASPGAEA